MGSVNDQMIDYPSIPFISFNDICHAFLAGFPAGFPAAFLAVLVSLPGLPLEFLAGILLACLH